MVRQGIAYAPQSGGSMGGKRPDQHQLDPGEGRATDYKFRRNPAEGLEHPLTEKGGQPIPPKIPSPDAENPVTKPEKSEETEENG
jgi:hypothetical protein